jgi:Mg-chelatase subunit ChlD
MVTRLETVAKEYYSLLFPLVFIPKSKTNDTQFSMKVSITSSTRVDSIHCSTNLGVVSNSEDDTGFQLEQHGDLPDKDLQLTFTSQGINVPKISF